MYLFLLLRTTTTIVLLLTLFILNFPFKELFNKMQTTFQPLLGIPFDSVAVAVDLHTHTCMYIYNSECHTTPINRAPRSDARRCNRHLIKHADTVTMYSANCCCCCCCCSCFLYFTRYWAEYVITFGFWGLATIFCNFLSWAAFEQWAYEHDWYCRWYWFIDFVEIKPFNETWQNPNKHACTHQHTHIHIGGRQSPQSVNVWSE